LPSGNGGYSAFAGTPGPTVVRKSQSLDTLSINRHASRASQPIVMAQTSPLIGHADLAQFPIGLADTDWHRMRRHQAWHCF
jgi:hypothetical protein